MIHQTFFNLPEEKRERILRSAVREFNSHSYEKSSINRILESIQIPKGSFYQYFDSKEDLYILCIREIYENLLKIRLEKGETLLNTGYKRAERLGFETMLADYQKEIQDMIGEESFQLFQGLPHVPSSVRNFALTEIAVNVILPEMKKELSEMNLLPEQDLDYIAYLLSLSEMIALDYGSRRQLPIEQMNKLTYQYMDMIFHGIQTSPESDSDMEH